MILVALSADGADSHDSLGEGLLVVMAATGCLLLVNAETSNAQVRRGCQITTAQRGCVLALSIVCVIVAAALFLST